MLLVVGPSAVEQNLGSLPGQGCPLGREQGFCDNLLRQCMPPPEDRPVLHQQVCRHRLAQTCPDRVRLLPRQRRKERPVGLTAEHRCRPHRIPGPRGERVEPAVDLGGEGCGHRGSWPVLLGGPDSRHREVLDQQRQSLGAGHDVGRELGHESRPEPGLGQLHDLRCAQRPQRQDRRARRRREPVYDVGPGPVVAGRDDDQHLGVADRGTEELQESDRVRIGPVGVLDNEEAPAFAHAVEQPHHALAEHERWIHVDPVDPVFVGVGPFGEQPPQRGSVGPDRRRAVRRVRAKRRQKRLRDGPVRRPVLHGRAGQHRRSVLPRVLLERPQQPGLAEAGLSGDQHE